MNKKEAIPIEVQYDQSVLDKVEKLGRYEGFYGAFLILWGISFINRKLRKKKPEVQEENEES